MDKLNLESYPMGTYPVLGSRKCGIGIVIVNENFVNAKDKRKGAAQEIESLNNLLAEEFSLEIFCYKDMTSKEMTRLMFSLSGKGYGYSKYPRIKKKHQILVIAISSHGRNDGITTSDTVLLNFNEIREFFNAERCPLLIDKPKMFLFNCCRTLEDGVIREESAFPLSPHRIEADGLNSDGDSSEELEAKRVASKWSDFITVNFCVRSIASLRSTTSGSLIIREFYDAFKSYGHEFHFQAFMTAFTRDVKPKIYLAMKEHRDSPITQCPEVTSTLDRLLYFPVQKRELQPIGITGQTSKFSFHYSTHHRIAPHKDLFQYAQSELSDEEFTPNQQDAESEYQKTPHFEIPDISQRKKRSSQKTMHSNRGTSQPHRYEEWVSDFPRSSWTSFPHSRMHNRQPDTT